MITPTTINDYVQRHAKQLRKRGMQSEVRKKKATVIAATRTGKRLGYQPKTVVVEQGTAYSRDKRWSQRAVFFEEPVTIDGETFYKELKGYGDNAQDLYPYPHDEGDLFYGMYADLARKEYGHLERIAKLGNHRTQQALAVAGFSREEFITHALRGLAGILEHPRQETLGKTKEDIERTLRQAYEQGGLEQVRILCNPELEHLAPGRINPFSSIDLERGAGYVVRATRAPFRLVAGEELGINREDLNEAAHEAGRLYGEMINQGLLHLVPSWGNITIAGELMDFEDVEQAGDHEPIQHLWDYYNAHHEDGSLRTFEDFIDFTLGGKTTLPHVPAFIQGTGLGNTPRQVAQAVIAMHEKEFKRLL